MNQRFALLSVTDKSGIVQFAHGLVAQGFKIISTGGTFKLLQENKIEATQVSEVTNFPECFDGRIKTLHPKVHAGILFDRNRPQHLVDQEKLAIPKIDLVCVNLYDFASNAIATNLSLEEAIEHIDIGGPTMLRAAAKNWQHCLSVCDPKDYARVLESLAAEEVSPKMRLDLSHKVFSRISAYDRDIANYFSAKEENQPSPCNDLKNIEVIKPTTLRYGENPQQIGLFYQSPQISEPVDLKPLQGKEISFNNLLDLHAAATLVHYLHPIPSCTVVKHNTPCGVFSTEQASPQELISKSRAGDPKSAFGGIYAFNIQVDEKAAQELCQSFVECVVAPEFSEEALSIFAAKPNLRVLQWPWLKTDKAPLRLDVRSIHGGLLCQTVMDANDFDSLSWQMVTDRIPVTEERQDLAIAEKIAAIAKSNAIVLVKNNQLIGIGAGQTSRIDALQAAISKAQEFGFETKGSVLASDAFFPFPDCVQLAAEHGISAIIQPGGSKKDEESIKAANDAQIAMICTGRRYFRH